MPKFHPMFSDEWEAERAEFYRGLFSPDPTRPEDGDVTKIAVSMVGGGVYDKVALRGAVSALLGRLMTAHSVVATWGDTSPQKDGVAEAISDSALVMAYLKDALDDHGPPHTPAIHLKKRGEARASSAAVVRDACAMAAEKALLRSPCPLGCSGFRMPTSVP